MVLILRTNAPDWERKNAKCLGIIDGPAQPDPFFGHERESADWELALAICNGDYDGKVCPARHECLLFALTNNEAWGVWGGLSVQQRHQLRRHNPREAWQWKNAVWPPPEMVEEQLMDDDDTCDRCGEPTGPQDGSHYHCANCGGVCSMMGHYSPVTDGYTCKPEDQP